MNEIEKIIEGEIEESESSRGHHDDLLRNRGERKNRTKSQMLSLRVSSEDLAEIERIAALLDVPVSALVRGWILAGLAEQRGMSVPDAVERVAAEVERLRHIVSR